MKKILVGTVLLALLAVPLFSVAAKETVTICHATGADNKWVTENPAKSGDVSGHAGAGHQEGRDIIPPFNFDGGSFPGQNWDADGQAIYNNGCEIPEPEPEPCDANDSTTRVLQSTEFGEFTPWVWDADQQLFVRSRTVTEHWHAISDLDGRTICAEGDVELDDEVETRRPEGRIILRQDCNGWGLMQEGQLIDSGTWDLPFELEVATSQFVDYRIFEGDECLKVRGDPTLRIGGRCTEDGDSQEIGYVFDDGDFDGARLIITRQDGVEVANVGEGSDFFPARAAGYSWQIIWFNGETREVLDFGEFEVNKCDLPEPTPTPKPPPEHPPTGGEMDAGLAVVTGLMGFALAGIGGSILFMKRRASR